MPREIFASYETQSEVRRMHQVEDGSTILNSEFDVAVVGGGPAGSAAAKRCAEHGLKTLLLEKSKLPRNKVCTGMIMSEMAQSLIRDEFGQPPREVLTTPPYIRGLKFHTPEVETVTLERRMPFAWRSDFDYWLNRVAQGAGVELWHKTRVKSLAEEEGYTLSLEREGKSQLLKTRFLIGADGAFSMVRKALFPEAPMRLQLNLRLCYQGKLELEPEYVHFFYLPDLTGFDINFKGDVFLLEITPRPNQGNGADIVRQAEAWLAREYGFVPGSRPLWRDGCYEPAMRQRPFPGPFPLAKDNALIVGNAAGLIVPVTGEGIGTAIKSGLMAADAVIKAREKGEKAADFYLSMSQDLVSTIESMYPPPGRLRDEARKGMDCFLEAIKETYSRYMSIR